MTHLDTDVIYRQAFPEMVDAYKTACYEVDRAFELLKSAKERLDSAYGHSHSFDCIGLMRYHNTADEVKKQIRKSAWESLLERMELKKVMSIKDLDKIGRSFEDINNIPEIELTTLIEITTGLLENAPQYAKNMVNEAYEILMPGNSKYDIYKTNSKNARRKLGKKVVLTWFIDREYYGELFHVGIYRVEDKLMVVDKVFHTLDGKGVPSGYRSPLVDAINTTPKNKGFGETDYFKFRCYLNGNLHLEFKRMDLVEKLNRVAGNSTTLTD